MTFLALQVSKNYTASCSALYWVLNSLQIPVAVGVTIYEAHGLVTGKRVLSSKGSQQGTLKPRQLFVYCLFGIIAGLVGGLLGLGGGFNYGAIVLRARRSSRGFKCHINICDDVLIFHVGHRILPLAPVSSTLCWLLRRCCIWCCHHRPVLCEEVDKLVRESIIYYLHTGFHDLRQRAHSWYGAIFFT
jgi:hypothetical protein